ncbi:MAG TPA: hypothetical protein PK861_07920, partial [Thermomonas sp.]|nr:hypothetical protein [Thermomonas sp.]
ALSQDQFQSMHRLLDDAGLGEVVAGVYDGDTPGSARRKLREQAGLKRLFLHAASLEFALDGGKQPYRLTAPLAPELVAVLDRLHG